MSTLSTTTSGYRPASPSVGDTLYETDTNRVITCSATGPVVWRVYDSDGVAYTTAGTNELNYPTGLWSSAGATYYLSVSPVMHFDAKILDGADSDNNPANGADVPVWGDRSGSGTDYDLSQSTASYQPHFFAASGIHGVTTSAAGNHILNLATSFALAAADDLTQIIVATNTDLGENSISGLSPASHANANSIFVAGGGNGALKIGGVDATGPPTFSQSDPNLHVLTKQGTAFEYWWQGGAANQSKTATVNNTFTKMFTQYSTSGNDCRIHEVLVFSSEVSLANLNIIKNYVNAKYSMSVSDLT